jgi:uncharacterized membrane protein
LEFHSVIDTVSKVVDGLGVAVIVVGLVFASLQFIWEELKGWRGKELPAGRIEQPYEYYRQSLGRSILIGLEFLIAGDIIRTVAVSPTFYNLGALAILVVIRSFLSWGLSMEIEGRWPWQAPRPKAKPVGFSRESAGD